MHLAYAEQLRAVLWEQPAEPGVAATIEGQWPAFYLGSVAPDYQVICDVPREASHFYPLPLPSDWDAVATMLERWPELAAPATLSPAHVTFVAAYLAHLLLDEVWFREVLLPHFVQPEHLGSMSERMLLHNMTLIYLDRQSLDALPADAGRTLSVIRSDNWLPFATDDQLAAWQTMLVDQLLPQGVVQTVPIFAGRMGLHAEELEARLSDDAWLNQELFARVSIADVEAALANSLPRAAACVTGYLRRVS